MGGLGKTTVAKELAHYLKNKHIFQIVVWTEVGRSPDIMSLLESWGRYSDSAYEANRQLTTLMQAQDAKTRLERAIKEACDCHPKRVLVILDDVWDLDAVRVLYEAKPDNAMVLITTRQQSILPPLGAQTYEIKALRPDHAANLLHQYLDTSETYLLQRLGGTLKGHPLALTIASQRAKREATRPGSDLSYILKRHIHQYQQGLPNGTPFQTLELDPGKERHDSLTVSLAYSYDALPMDQDRSRFRSLGVLANVPFDIKLLAALWQLPISEVERQGCDVLCQSCLLEKTEIKGSYRLHPLLNAYAKALLRQQSEEEAVLALYADYILDIAKQLSTRFEEWTLFEADLPHLDEVGNRMIRMYEDMEGDISPKWAERLMSFAERTTRYVMDRPHLVDYSQERRGLNWLQTGLEVAKRFEQPETEAILLTTLGKLWTEEGQKEEALNCYKMAWSLYRHLKNLPMQAKTINRVGQTLSAMGEKEKALLLLEQLLPLLRKINSVIGEAQALSDIGRIYYDLQKYPEALSYYEKAFNIYAHLKDSDGQAMTLSYIGQVWYVHEDAEQALGYYNKALALYRETQNKNGEVMILHHIGQAWHQLRDNHKALESYEHTLPVFKAIRNRGGEAMTLVYMGQVWESLAERQRALEHYEQARALYNQIGDIRNEAAICYNMGLVYIDLGDLIKAVVYVERCVTLEIHFNHPELEKDQQMLSRLKQQRDKLIF